MRLIGGAWDLWKLQEVKHKILIEVWKNITFQYISRAPAFWDQLFRSKGQNVLSARDRNTPSPSTHFCTAKGIGARWICDTFFEETARRSRAEI